MKSRLRWTLAGLLVVGLGGAVAVRVMTLGPSVLAIDRVSTMPFVPPEAAAGPLAFTIFQEGAGIRVEQAALRPRPAARRVGFWKMEGHEIGLVRGFRQGIRDHVDPFWLGRGTAAGDFDGDGWDDIAFGTSVGPVLYRNRGGWFELVPQTDKSLDALDLFAVAFIDWNNDGALDFFFTTFGQGNYWVRNEGGNLDFSRRERLPNGDAVVTASPAFADLGGKGWLDVINGNVALGVLTGTNEYGKGRAATILWHKGDELREEVIGEPSGETFATLVTDLNADGRPDIYMARDYDAPDTVLLGEDGGTFRAVTARDGMIRQTPTFSRAVDSGDLNNDLVPDLVLSGTLGHKHGNRVAPIDEVDFVDYSRGSWGIATCNGIKDTVMRQNCVANRSGDYLRPKAVPDASKRKIAACHQGGAGEREVCELENLWLLTSYDEMTKDCTLLTLSPRLAKVCAVLAQKGKFIEQGDFPNAIPQRDDAFVLLGRGGAFHNINLNDQDVAFDHPGGSTWNSRIADLDQDGWQDILNAEGALHQNDWGWNVYMHNVRGERFEQKQFSHSLVDDFALFSFALVDIDRDGDLDVIGNSSMGPVQVYINQTQGHGFCVSLRDMKGNRFGIGARVTIAYSGGHQMREIKASGGYMSFDPLVAHFGLGETATVDSITVRWPDGVESAVAGPFKVETEIRVTRL